MALELRISAVAKNKLNERAVKRVLDNLQGNLGAGQLKETLNWTFLNICTGREGLLKAR
jgi:hypothetical protein